jgi:tetratricopeptide (TPR) repeat protein
MANPANEQDTMRALFFYFFTTSCIASFAAAPSFSSKAFSLGTEAEKQLAQGNLENAILLFEQALEDPSFRRLGEHTRLCVALSLSRAYQNAKKFSKQEEFVKKLLIDRLYSSYKILLKTHLGSCYLAQEKIDSAQAIMKEMLRKPNRVLNSEDKRAIASLYRLISYYIEGLALKAQEAHARGSYKQAKQSFETVYKAYEQHFVLSQKTKHLFLCQLEYAIACCQYLSKEYAQALKTLEERYTPLYLASCELSELYWKGNFLMALCYKHLGDTANSDELFQHISVSSSSFAQEALWQQAFSKKSKIHVPYRDDETLYFLGRLTNDASFFTEVVTHFPASDFAQESYMRIFKDEEYAAGSYEAIHHLLIMPKELQVPPFSTLRAFYLGMSYEKANDQIELARSFFEIAISESRSSEKLKKLFLEALVRKANLSLLQGEVLASYEALTELSSFFSKASTCEKKKWITLWQKSLFLLAAVYEKKADVFQAQKTRQELYTLSTQYDAVQGNLIAETLLNLAIHVSSEKSFRLLDIAENCKDIDREMLLNIWLTRSHILVENGQIDLAMQYLSRVINDHLASSLRIRAMFLRADIYEMTGRVDLAKKQLDFIIEKGGEWASLAQTRRSRL